MTLQEKKQGMITYLKLKVEEQDWHAVQDAGSDLREIEVEIRLTQTQAIHPTYAGMGITRVT